MQTEIKVSSAVSSELSDVSSFLFVFVNLYNITAQWASLVLENDTSKELSGVINIRAWQRSKSTCLLCMLPGVLPSYLLPSQLIQVQFYSLALDINV